MIKKLLFVFVLASVFVQCEVPVHEEYDLYGDGIDDDDDNPNPSNSTWWPLTVDNQWNYTVTDQNGTNTQTIKITGTTQYNNKTYFVLETDVHVGSDIVEGQDILIRKDSNGNYTYVVILELEDLGFAADPIVSHPMKDNIDPGDSWTENVVYHYTQPMDISYTSAYTYKYEEHFNTMEINGITYHDIAKVKTSYTTQGQSSQGYVYYAKNIGPIKTEGENLGSASTTLITSYHLE
jgi:hypothetical protein